MTAKPQRQMSESSLSNSSPCEGEARRNRQHTEATGILTKYIVNLRHCSRHGGGALTLTLQYFFFGSDKAQPLNSRCVEPDRRIMRQHLSMQIRVNKSRNASSGSVYCLDRSRRCMFACRSARSVIYRLLTAARDFRI